MTRLEKKNFLCSYKDECLKIVELQLEYEKWETVAESMTQKLSDMPHSSEVSSKIESASIEMVNIQGKIRKAMEIKESIENGIYGIKSHCQKLILEEAYIKGITFREISEKWNKDIKNIYQIHRYALDSFKIK